MPATAFLGSFAPITVIGRKNSVAWKRTSPLASLMAGMGGKQTVRFRARTIALPNANGCRVGFSPPLCAAN